MMMIWLALLLASSAASAPNGQSCIEGPVQLRTDFPGARAEDCIRTETGFAVTIAPERRPVNKSPWYAFDITGPAAGAVTVELRYAYGRHRYIPKRQDSAGLWHPLAPSDVSVAEDRSTAVLTLTPQEGRMRIAAQPVYSPAERRAWAEDFASRAGFARSVAGVSPNGHPLVLLRSEPGTQAPLHVLLLGGQHPPEVPGALAMRAFLERLAEGDELAREFRARVAIDVFPTLNPDGIAAGHWRLNAALVDLNRDWGPFTQAETRLVRDTLRARTDAGARPVLMVDFHATFKGDILYTPTGEDGAAFAPVIDGWTAAIDQRLDEPGFVVDARSNTGLPTAKSWFAETYDAPGVTLEIGDETEPGRASRLGRAAAEAMMETVLKTYLDGVAE